MIVLGLVLMTPYNGEGHCRGSRVFHERWWLLGVRACMIPCFPWHFSWSHDRKTRYTFVQERNDTCGFMALWSNNTLTQESISMSSVVKKRRKKMRKH